MDTRLGKLMEQIRSEHKLYCERAAMLATVNGDAQALPIISPSQSNYNRVQTAARMLACYDAVKLRGFRSLSDFERAMLVMLRARDL